MFFRTPATRFFNKKSGGYSPKENNMDKDIKTTRVLYWGPVGKGSPCPHCGQTRTVMEVALMVTFTDLSTDLRERQVEVCECPGAFWTLRRFQEAFSPYLFP